MGFALQTPFNAHLVDPMAQVGQLPVCPEGMPVIITASEPKAAKSGGNNFFVELMLQVVDGPHKGETGPFRLNLGNDNETAMRIANQQLSSICHATGQMIISDIGQLHNIPFVVTTAGKEVDDGKGGKFTSSEVKKILDIRGNAPGKAAPSQPANATPAAQSAPAFTPPASAPAAGAPPWAK